MKIFKYPITVVNEPFFVTLPERAVPISVGIDGGFEGGGPVFWAFVPNDEPVVPRRFLCLFTGVDLPKECEAWRFIGTAMSLSGMVFHLFSESL